MATFDWLPAVVASAGSAVIMVAGGVLTDKTGWYKSLRKPAWQPPDWAFAPAWTAIYVLVTWASVLAWKHAGGVDAMLVLATAFILNGMLNIGWSLVFFTWRRPDHALWETAPLWLSTVLLGLAYHAVLPLAGWLIAPYVVWVAFAAWLNLAIVRLNRPFARRSSIADLVAFNGGLSN